MERERRSQEVAAEPFQTLAVPGVDADARVEGKAALEGAAACLLEGLRVPQPPVHLGGLQGGEGVGLRLEVVEADQELRGAHHDAGEDRGHVLVARLSDGEERL